MVFKHFLKVSESDISSKTLSILRNEDKRSKKWSDSLMFTCAFADPTNNGLTKASSATFLSFTALIAKINDLNKALYPESYTTLDKELSRKHNGKCKFKQIKKIL